MGAGLRGSSGCAASMVAWRGPFFLPWKALESGSLLFLSLCGLKPGRGPGFSLVPSGDECFKSSFSPPSLLKMSALFWRLSDPHAGFLLRRQVP